MTKSAVTFTEEIFNGKVHFLCSVTGFKYMVLLKMQPLLYTMHGILAIYSSSNMIIPLKELLFCNNVLESADKIHQEHFLPLRKLHNTERLLKNSFRNMLHKALNNLFFHAGHDFRHVNC